MAKKEQETIYVPGGITKTRYHQRAIALMWWMVDWWNEDEQGWCKIHGDFFEKITTDSYTMATAKAFLIDNRYMETLSHVKGKVSTRYRLLDHPDELVPFQVPKDRIDRCWPYSTQDDEACLWYRQNLDLLERIEGKEQIEIADTEDGKRSDQFTIKTLEKKKGNVHRGRLDEETGLQINRIYSPWVNASRRVRPLFMLAGERMTILDLRASQVALLAARYGDDKLLVDCANDRFYRGLLEHLKDKDVFKGYHPKGWKQGDAVFKPTDRNSIKEPFFAWYFGNSPSPYARKFRREIQKWMDERYPVTAKGVREEKEHKNTLAVEQQIIEATTFVDGIYLDLKQLAIPSLLVHDAVYVGETHASKTREVVEHHLNQIHRLYPYHLKASANEYPEKTISFFNNNTTNINKKHNSPLCPRNTQTNPIAANEFRKLTKATATVADKATESQSTTPAIFRKEVFEVGPQ
jgi:hypothetical protein